MARKLTFVPNIAGGTVIALEDIPEDVQADVNEAYETLRKTDGRIRAEFDTEEEANLFCRQAASYAAQRPEGKLKFRRSPTKNLAKNIVDFRVTADLEANGEDKAKGKE